MVGRDIGTVVLPEAECKIYLDASPEERARRRAADPAHAAGRQAALADIASELQARDHSDRTRAASPLSVAADAILVDTTDLTIEQVVDRVFRIVEEKATATGR
jgi:cytidylate kinase